MDDTDKNRVMCVTNGDHLPNTIRVKLKKKPEVGLGFLAHERQEAPHVVVHELLPGGAAEESGLVQVGDCLVRLNNIDVSIMTYAETIKLLKSIPDESQVVLLLRGPAGYSSHLETIFLDDGTPKTIRVTAPPGSPMSPFRRIKHPVKDRAETELKQRMTGYDGDNRSSNTTGSVVKASNITTDSYISESTDWGHVNHTKACPEPAATGQSSPSSHNGGSPRIVVTDSTTDESYGHKEVQDNTPCLYSPPGPQEAANGGGKSVEIRQTDDQIIVMVKKDANNHNGTALNGTGADIPGSNAIKSQGVNLNPGTPRSAERSPSEDTGGHTEREGSVASGLNRKGSSPSKRRYVKLKNVEDANVTYTDTLYTKSLEGCPCTAERCLGSVMKMPGKRQEGGLRHPEELERHAADLINQYYSSIKRLNTTAHQKRLEEVRRDIQSKGTYDLTSSELTFGAKTAWRNAPRCIGRIQWSKLQVFDARHILTARGMFEAICNHIKYSTNKGNLRSAITIFPARKAGKCDFRVWNAQLIRYAGYRRPDGSVIGDPVSVEFTEVCVRLGWKPKYGMFDVLPLVLSANGQDPELFTIPQELILEVTLKHPNYPWFEKLGLKWYGLPAVSGMMLDCGGLEFTAIPFSGWFMGTEIGSRDLCDKSRYDILPTVAKHMGLDTRTDVSLWKDEALVVVNAAVLYSYQQANVTIIDHHSASDSFMKFQENEYRQRGGCPADWVWIVPPLSSSITPVFHQEMLNYVMKPSYEYQDDPWRTHEWKKPRKERIGTSSEGTRRKISFRDIARAVKFSAKLMGKALARRIKCTILYATETGKSERYAKTLCETFKHAFDARVLCMGEYDALELEHEALVLIVTSTFGNGDPPENGEVFGKTLYEMRYPTEHCPLIVDKPRNMRLAVSDEQAPPARRRSFTESMSVEAGPLSNVRFSVFALGSRAYPHFCAYGKYVDKLFGDLGGERIHQIGEGDELCGQEQAFKMWAQHVFKESCEVFCVGDDVTVKDVAGTLAKNDLSWAPGKYRLTPEEGAKDLDLCKGLSHVHNRSVFPTTLVSSQNLQAEESSRRTLLLKLNTGVYDADLSYFPGDHVAIYPANQSDQVSAILGRLMNAPDPDEVVSLEVLRETGMSIGNSKHWERDARFPLFTLRHAFSRYLDITTPPSQMLLSQLAQVAGQETEKHKLEQLSKDNQAYEDWKFHKYPTLSEVLEEFPSVKVPPALLLSQLPLLQQRFYSISSSPASQPGQIHATVAVVSFRTQGGDGPLHRGVCSSWLDGLKEGDIVPCCVRSAPSFHMPEDKSLPVIMVGPGTGIAPFRSFWQQRKIDLARTTKETKFGPMTLYFGCRQGSLDNIYGQETEELKREGVLTENYLALSREPGVPKCYVQDIIRDSGREVCRQIKDKNGHFYVCGDVSMAADVSKTLQQTFQEHGGMGEQEAKLFLMKLKEQNRFHEDIFGVTLRTSEVQGRMRDEAKKSMTGSERGSTSDDTQLKNRESGSTEV